MFAKKRHQEKALMKKTIAMHEEKEQKHKADDGAPQNAVPAYLLERDQVGGCSKTSYHDRYRQQFWQHSRQLTEATDSRESPCYSSKASSATAVSRGS
jgi:hypothetical protein